MGESVLGLVRGTDDFRADEQQGIYYDNGLFVLQISSAQLVIPVPLFKITPHSFILLFYSLIPFLYSISYSILSVHLPVFRSHPMHHLFFSFVVALCLYTGWAIAALTSDEIANSLNELAQQGFAAKDLVLEINSTADAGPIPVSRFSFSFFFFF